MAIRISNAAAIVALDALLDLLDAGGGGYIEIRTGSQPAGVDVAATGTLLATLQLSSTAFAGATDGTPGATASANSITSDSSADATGTAGWFRAYNNAGTGIIDGSAGEGSEDLVLDSASITIGGTVAITAWTATMSEG